MSERAAARSVGRWVNMWLCWMAGWLVGWLCVCGRLEVRVPLQLVGDRSLSADRCVLVLSALAAVICEPGAAACRHRFGRARPVRSVRGREQPDAGAGRVRRPLGPDAGVDVHGQGRAHDHGVGADERLPLPHHCRRYCDCVLLLQLLLPLTTTRVCVCLRRPDDDQLLRPREQHGGGDGAVLDVRHRLRELLHVAGRDHV